MINRIIDFSVQHKFLMMVCAALACIGGWWSMQALPLDAMPDLSETQVIIYSRWDRSPDIIEDQVTYPIVTAMVGAPKVKTVRGVSDFGYSYVYVIFEDGAVVRMGAIFNNRAGSFDGTLAAQISHTLIGNDDLHRMLAMIEVTYQWNDRADLPAFRGGRTRKN